MNNDKPKNLGEYKRWLKEEHQVTIDDEIQRYFESVTMRIEKNFEKSDFWIQLTENLKRFTDEYQLKIGHPLLVGEIKAPKLFIKSFDSFLLKTYRKNIIENVKWPKEPESGWILPNNWYSKINDIIRTLFVVKYLDGVEFISEKIQSHCEEFGLPCKVDFEVKEEGYYAAHLYTKQKFEIIKRDWSTEIVNVSIEIQITTQLQEVIRILLHKYYDERRKEVRKEDVKWQWNYKSDEFAANYLGHVLHYLEGMIMEVMEKQKRKI